MWVMWVVLACQSVGPGAYAQPARDLVSDAVGATAGVFRVDESGQATYSISIAVPPGTAGVAPTLSLDYSSQGGMGVAGKGWSIGGQSAIERCRRTREAGDYVTPGGFGFPTSNPFVTAPPIGFRNDDAFCLDGQRLLLVSGAYGANNAVYRPELDPFTRVTSKGGNNDASPATYTGPQYFTVERRDGSTSEYGNSVDARIERNHCGVSTGIVCAVSAWALNRVEDSTGNYLSYHYRKFLNTTETTSGAGSDEYVLSEVRYTGKRVLPGQSASASAPYARVLFGYSPDTITQQRGWQAGSQVAQTLRLDWIKVQDPFAGTPLTLRYYGLSYATSGSNSGSRQLVSVQECNKGPGDTGVDAAQVCYPATTFTESTARYQFDVHSDSTFLLDAKDRKGARYGDVDGDGRLDLAWVKSTGESVCKSRIYVSYGDRLASGGISRLTLATPYQQAVCVTQEISEGSDGWQLFDYDGDGRDDLLVLDNSTGGGWRVYAAASQRPASSGASAFVTGTDLLNGLSLGDTLLRLIDLDGDGLLDVLYAVQDPVNPFEYHLRSRLRERYEISPVAFGLRFGTEKPFQIRFAPDDPCSWEYPGTPKPTSCSYTLAPWSRDRLVAAEIDGDGRGDLMFQVSRTYDALQGDGETEVRFLLPDQMDALHAELAAAPESVSFQRYWQFFTSRVDPFLVEFQSYDSLRIYENSVGEMPTDARHIQLADFNGDGLTDLLYRVPSVSNGQTWRLRLNTGTGFTTAFYDATGIVNPDLAQVADVNVDGRADLLYPPTGSTCGAGDVPNASRPFCVRYGQGASGTMEAARHVPGGGAWATASPLDHEHFFADFDGDGAVDYVRFKRAGSSTVLFTSRSSTRHQARDVAARITDGIGAVTQIDYQPLTNAGVYRRDTGSLTAVETNGRGSPTFDLLAPMYVVAKASSSAPTYENAAAMAEVGYRYTGAKLQSGGRGFLGFREIATFDGVHEASPARHVVSRTAYRQDFPFVGSPDTSEKRVVASALGYGSAAIDACRADPEAIGQSCFYSVGATWPTAVGTRISASVNIWACQGALDGSACPLSANPIRQACVDLDRAALRGEFSPLSNPQPIFPYLIVSSEEASAYNSDGAGNGAWLGTTESAFCYEDTFGNLTYSRVNQWDGTGPAGRLLFSVTWEDSSRPAGQPVGWHRPRRPAAVLPGHREHLCQRRRGVAAGPPDRVAGPDQRRVRHRPEPCLHELAHPRQPLRLRPGRQRKNRPAHPGKSPARRRRRAGAAHPPHPGCLRQPHPLLPVQRVRGRRLDPDRRRVQNTCPRQPPPGGHARRDHRRAPLRAHRLRCQGPLRHGDVPAVLHRRRRPDRHGERTGVSDDHQPRRVRQPHPAERHQRPGEPGPPRRAGPPLLRGRQQRRGRDPHLPLVQPGRLSGRCGVPQPQRVLGLRQQPARAHRLDLPRPPGPPHPQRDAGLCRRQLHRHLCVLRRKDPTRARQRTLLPEHPCRQRRAGLPGRHLRRLRQRGVDAPRIRRAGPAGQND
ncbi:MAG TPA: toxin TcdB middle/N-terminal domain-containing protein, partial [Chiayiivirga sp.]|nr:toxin TcdB middle/N-terminal domain-containing protein [Chiayiivirga sp.]